MSRILIVDDQIDVRRVLRSGLEVLGPEFEIIDMPSGEEALLETNREPIDLLIADVRLAGMSGLELKKKVQTRCPQAKAILITGVPDIRFRREVADAKADAFFYKPIPMDEFLKAVQHCLGLAKPDFLRLDDQAVIPIQGITDRLSRLRQEINAISAILLDEHGQALVTNGALPGATGESALIPALMVALTASGPISCALGMPAVEDLLCYAGARYDLALGHVGPAHALLIVIDKSLGSEYWGTLGFHARLAAHDLALLLSIPDSPCPPIDEAVTPVQAVLQPLPQPEKRAPTEKSEPPELAFDLEAIFQAQPHKSLKTDELNAYWEAFADKSAKEGLRTDSLTFEQAQQLGLAPGQRAD